MKQHENHTQIALSKRNLNFKIFLFILSHLQQIDLPTADTYQL